MLQNKYSTWYYSIIAKRQAEPASGYTEKHHIIPTSLGGLNVKDNVVRLTAREHFVCHKILVRMTIGKDRSKMAKAVWLLKHTRCRDVPLTSRSFALLRQEYADACRATSLGMKASTETKAKMSAASLGKLKSESHRHNIKLARNARGDLSEQAYANLSAAKSGSNNPNFGKRGNETSMFGKKQSRQSRAAISKAFTGSKWWNNGHSCKRSHECPGSEWERGRLHATKLRT